MRRILLTISAAALFSTPVAAGETIDPAREYPRCMALARDNPVQGWELALAWTSLGGGDPARHCAAVALIGQGKYEEAATRLESLAQESRAEPEIRAGMLAQAGQAWLMAGQVSRADAVQTAALALVPDDVELRIDRAVTLAEAGRHAEALVDLDAALAIDPGRADALSLRASAHRQTGNLAAALADAEAALKSDFSHAEAWLEYGLAKYLSGDAPAAREAWQRVLAMAPDGELAQLAQRNIEMLDISAP
ncbi:tetratricopeptide repeat protein [Telmatospirillum sp. J64-1]|uniref:tetratricopeptide repeat protein n=1 Tax=Telmatospirillum sp. J64-1 TaxID=2502183 RepID=UPI00115E476F|nr:tetratricopeptide repeat protein [Telmatospirillum sp. J64-1]